MTVPSGFFGVLLALSHRLAPGLAGPTLFYSTFLSIGTLPIVLLLLPRI
jgi:predicted permease